MENLARKQSESNSQILWEVVIKACLSHRSYKYEADITDGRARIGLYGTRVSSLYPYAQLKAELIGLKDVFDWICHLGKNERSRIVLSHGAYTVLLGESPCLPELRSLRHQLLKRYIASGVSLIKQGDLPPTAPAQERRVAA
jgi:hypothetical protein